MAAERISRRHIARYAAVEIVMNNNKKAVLEQIAAYLIESGRQREVDLLARDIETEMTNHGDCIADITTAHPLSEALRKELTQFITESDGAQQVFMREHVEPSVIGGVKMRYGGRELDTTIRTKLKKLAAQN